MEHILTLYQRPYNPRRPLICFDEKSVQLLAHTREPVGLQSGKPNRQDYEYKREGTRNLFLFAEPKVGQRHVLVTNRRLRKLGAICNRRYKAYARWDIACFQVQHTIKWNGTDPEIPGDEVADNGIHRVVVLCAKPERCSIEQIHQTGQSLQIAEVSRKQRSDIWEGCWVGSDCIDHGEQQINILLQRWVKATPLVEPV